MSADIALMNMSRRVKVSVYRPEEWEAKRAVIKRLYVVEQKSLAEVLVHLANLGFRVNERMIKTRIQKWKFDRNRKWPEMRTAAEILAADGQILSGTKPRFLIRGTVVTYDELLRYFKRKQIHNPVLWVKEHPDPAFKASSDVQLISSDTRLITPEESSDSSDPDSRASDQSTSLTDKSETSESSDFYMFYPEITHRVNSDALVVFNQPSSLVTEPSTPLKYIFRENMVWKMQNYCASYFESPEFFTHEEPKVHQHTDHGLFGSRMQEGIFLVLRGEDEAAFARFKSGFGMIRALLQNRHPMALALFMAVICELGNHLSNPAMYGVLKSLIKYTEELTDVDLPEEHPIRAMFTTMRQAKHEAADLAVTSMRRAVDFFSDHAGPTNWKTLYLKERFCDCLYHARLDGERSQTRAQLLIEQEKYYGPTRRNVLWTLTNVADDYLLQARPDMAEQKFREALNRANRSLIGFERAKIRFAALEGLAKTALRIVDMAEQGKVQPHLRPPGIMLQDFALRKLEDAVEFLKDAEDDAHTWFDVTSQRTVRVRLQREELEKKIALLKAESEKVGVDEGIMSL